MDVLADAGVVSQPRALLGGAQEETPRLSRIQALMRDARERDEDAFLRRTEELAYLANTLVAGCSIQARPFTVREASDAAAAVCNLGLEARPHGGDDLVGVFQAGWTVLHRDVCLYTARRLVAVLKDLRCADRDIQSGLNALRIGMKKQLRSGTPWRAGEALDVIMSLDIPAWAALVGLISECPVVHGAIGASRESQARSVSASDFEFISESRQIAAVREFLTSLPQTLGS
jgi:hypothetical protein